jgi:hypothetical protein
MMTTPSQRRARVLGAVALLAPFMIVQAGRFLGETGLQTSNAGVSSATPENPGGAPLAPATSQQQRAVEWSVANASPRTERSPLRAPSAPPAPIALPQAPPDTPPAPPEDMLLASLHLNALMGQESTGVAVVNGKLHRIGEEVAAGWTLKLISARDRFVELEGPDGRTARLELGH